MRCSTVILAMLACLALAFSAPANSQTSSPGSPATFWQDTETQKYHCVGKDVVRCDITAGGSCFATDFCAAYCFMHDNGAACVDMGQVIEGNPSDLDVPTPEGPPVASDLSVAIRNASPQENKHFVCSKNRKSVLICRYGFCSTDYYCKSNEECKDKPVSCMSKSSSAQASKSEVRTVTDRTEPSPKLNKRNRSPKEKSSYVCSKDRASVLKCTYGFCATDYYCAKGHPCVDSPARCKKALQSLMETL